MDQELADRILWLAREGACHLHMIGVPGGHRDPIDTCPQENCVAVRKASGGLTSAAQPELHKSY